MSRILLVDDDPDQLEVRQLLFEQAGHQVRAARDAAAAIHHASECDLVCMDLCLPHASDGRALIRDLRQRWPDKRILVLSGWPEDLVPPERSMVDEIVAKPVQSKRLLNMISRIALLALALFPCLRAESSYPFQLDAPAEVIAEIDATVPGADWGRPGRESVMVTIAVDDRQPFHQMLYAGAERHRYPVFLGTLEQGAHQVRIERHSEYSARALTPQIHGVAYKQHKPGDSDYAVYAHAPVLYARPNTVGKFTDIPLLIYCERLGDGSLRYSVIFSNEDGGTSTRGLMARWGRVTDIEHVYQVWLDPAGKPTKTLIQTQGHKEIPFDGKRAANHPLLGVSTLNNMVDAEITSAVRYQVAPIVVTLGNTSREQVMDENPLTYLISARELEREGKLREYGKVDGTKISAPENYLFVELRLTNKEAELAVLIRRDGDLFWSSSNLGIQDLAIERSGWVRTAIELPPATQPGQVSEIAFQCLPLPKAENGGSCRVDAIGKMFFLDARQRPGPNFWQPRLDRGPWIIPSGSLREISLK